MTDTNEVTRLRDLKVSARDLLMIDPKDIHIEEGHNPRNYNLPENRQHLDELKESIRENGTQVPLLVRFDPGTKQAMLVDGECRLRANLELIAEGLEIVAVPVVGVSGGNEAERLIIALTANTGKPLSKWESGTAFVRLQKFGWDIPKIAKRMGYSERFVTEAIELSDAPEAVKTLLSEQAITPSLALSELRTNGAAAVETLKEKAREAQSKGKKTATKEQKNRVLNPKVLLNQILKVVESAEDDIFESDYRFVEVDRSALKRVAETIGFKKKEK